MEMGVAPAERDLEYVMEVGKRALAAHQEPPPDHRADPADPDVELVDGWNGLTGRDLGQGNQNGSRSSAPGSFHSPSLGSQPHHRARFHQDTNRRIREPGSLDLPFLGLGCGRFQQLDGFLCPQRVGVVAAQHPLLVRQQLGEQPQRLRASPTWPVQ